MLVVTRIIGLMTLMLALSGCMSDMIAEADKAPARQDQIVLVGKMVISPDIPQYVATGLRDPLGLGKKYAENRVGTAFSTQPVKPQGMFLYGNENRALPLSQTFFITVPRATLYLQEGVYSLNTAGMSQIKLPGGLRTRMPAGAQVAYVGTVVYRRDDFYTITSTTVRDEFARTLPEIRAKYGADVTVGKALLHRF
ncbi:hypothetical protein [Actibacterium sp. XHP0104]|uniref:hypothetical protein n=1 Tax=Actibacterium sp. XHP0104 TaxID=2984335 RepID=UPI0021E94784|nr:hypothetical protein [Actibacterium sp. XHP0104]MCV2881938.1 hypothetical protein [Actibacterium sp. XHP0104]